MTLTAEEFLRRFCPNVFSKDFVRIRFYGFLVLRARTEALPRCRLGPVVAPQEHHGVFWSADVRSAD
jgi:hypothetical protein